MTGKWSEAENGVIIHMDLIQGSTRRGHGLATPRRTIVAPMIIGNLYNRIVYSRGRCQAPDYETDFIYYAVMIWWRLSTLDAPVLLEVTRIQTTRSASLAPAPQW